MFTVSGGLANHCVVCYRAQEFGALNLGTRPFALLIERAARNGLRIRGYEYGTSRGEQPEMYRLETPTKSRTREADAS